MAVVVVGAQFTSNVSARSAIFFAWWKPFQITSTERRPSTRLEVGTEAAVRVEVLARADRDRGAVAHSRERDGIERVDLEPHERVAVERTRDAQHAFRRELKLRSTIGCAEPPVPSRKRVEQANESLFELGRRIALEPVALEAGHQHSAARRRG
jgi:hypothetical protein